MDKVLTWFIRIWVALAVLVNLMAIAGLFMGAESFWQGWQRVTETYSPFNVVNMIAEMVLFAPAIGAYVWRDRRRKRAQAPSVQSGE